MDAETFLDQCLRFDLETNEAGEIYALAARWKGRELQFSGHFKLADALAKLDQAAGEVELLLGHNLLHHDLDVLRGIAPQLRLLDMPVVDTLYLSPLAFPENPYHRLVKDYKLLRDARNDPLADVRLTETLWLEQCRTFAETSRNNPTLLRFFADCFRRPEHAGLARFFDALLASAHDPIALAQWLSDNLQSRVCRHALQQDLIAPLQRAQAEHGTLPQHWAYAVAWLQVAGGNSVLPPWVRSRFPDCAVLLQKLRDQPCNDPQCRYCLDHHDPLQQLQRWFGFPAFRAAPANDSGGSLQQDIVSRAIGGRPLFAILPTGGGKSLCFQVPALARHLRLGQLTVVISPLQALMKDQVDNLCERTGGNLAGALYGLLSTPERTKVLDDIRLGDLALLYISPEQLRNPSFQKAIAHREIAAWVFDEAHCLSKWGHDFRPDYLYAARFIKEFAASQKTPAAPVQCFTATAKRSVIEEIRAYFLDQLGQDLCLFEGGVDRDNLHFEVQAVTKAQKSPRLLELLQDRLPPDNSGSAVIYCASRQGTEDAAEYLNGHGLRAAHFHAGMDAGSKRAVQEAFVAGDLSIICATNAFGMGIDKDNVRLVIHLEIPGSLENYLQEAGRAGRDRADAQCILLYDEQDIETQFSLGAQSQLSQRDINEILRSLRRLRQPRAQGDAEVVLTSAELLRDDTLNISFDNADRQADTKVRSAIAWLERADLLQRNQNRTQVFQGRPLVRNLQHAREKIAAQNLSKRQQERWLAIIDALMQADSDDGFSADELAQHGAFRQASGDKQHETEAQRVMRTLHDMSKAGLIQKSTLLSALLRHKVKNTPQRQLQRICALEDALLALLREQAPDADEQHWQQLSLRHLNQHLLDQGLQSDSSALRKLLFSLAHDGQGLAADRGSLSLRQDSREHLQVRLHRGWRSLQATAKRRQAVAGVVLKVIQAKVPKGTDANAQLLVEFALEDLLQGLQQDTLLAADLKDPLAAAERGLLFLHEQKVIQLQKGLAVFRQAMTICIPAEANRRRYTKGDYEPLKYHHIERVFQVHVINEYARLGLERISQALALVMAYFNDSKKDFTRQYFPGRKDELAHALSEQAYQRITKDLSAVQAAVVSSPAEQNQLVLAGPGSGKTRLVVHRCAWLLQVQRVPARGILVLSFNRSAALELRRRLADLVGDNARGVTVLTYHGIALRLTGRSLAAAAEDNGQPPDWDLCLRQATALLSGEAEPCSDLDDNSGSAMRDELLRGYRHILVDEYQDIDAQQYALVSALAGRSLKDKDARLSILAVGDDDQNIYAFRDTNIAFIHRFQDDYQADTHLLTENYRSSACIIASANQLIASNQDRMKTDAPIRIDKRRRDQPRGGDWQALDALAQGRVQCLQVASAEQQALAALAELQRLRHLQPGLAWGSCAVLSRNWEQLQSLHALCRQHDIPVLLRAEQGKLPTRTRLREYARLLQWLQQAPEQTYSVDTLQTQLIQLAGDQIGNRWWRELQAQLEDWRIECGDTPQPPASIRDALYESVADNQRQGQDGDRLLLSTAHSAKGREFDHLLVLDGGWGSNARPDNMEEERRLYYVAMTRARQTLSLFELERGNNPHTRLLRQQLSTDTLLTRRPSPEPLAQPELLQRRHDLLGPADLFMDLAGRQPANHPIHRHLAALNPGDPLRLAAHHNTLRLLAPDGLPLAQLASGETTLRWQKRLTQLCDVRVVAVMQRRLSDIREAQYRSAIQVETWELPLVEVHWTPGPDH